jgi:hypothetical protein
MNRRLTRAVASLGAAAAAAAVLSLINSPAAWAAGQWNNHQTTFSINTKGRFVGRIDTSIWTGQVANATITSHVWSSDHQIDFWTKRENVGAFRAYRDFRDVNKLLAPGTRICVEGWQNTAVKKSSVGLPCTTVTD